MSHMAETRKRSFILSMKQLAYLEQEATRIGITVSDLMRRIVDQHRENLVLARHAEAAHGARLLGAQTKKEK